MGQNAEKELMSSEDLLYFYNAMAKGKTILNKERFGLTIDRLCHSLIEKHDDFSNTCIIGIQQKGVLFANRVIGRLKAINKKTEVKYGKLDITFFRDDFRTRETPLKASTTEIDFLLEGKDVILMDDVLYTGRTIHAAISALQQFGRPRSIEIIG